MRPLNIIGELMDLQAGEILPEDVDTIEVGNRIAERYATLWRELTETTSFDTGERWRVAARINRLNELIPGAWHEGDIMVEGASVYAPSTDVVALRQRVGMVFQRANPFPKSIFDNVAYGPALNRLAPRRDLPHQVENALPKGLRHQAFGSKSRRCSSRASRSVSPAR